MKAFASWLVLHLVAVAGLSAALWAAQYDAEPRRVAFAVDASHPMQTVWGDVPRLMDGIARTGARAEFAVVSTRGVVHGWQARPQLGTTRPFAPRKLAGLADEPLLAEADEVYLITNAGESEVAALPDWTLLQDEGW